MPAKTKRSSRKAAAPVAAPVTEVSAIAPRKAATLKLGSALSIREVAECGRVLRDALAAGVCDIDLRAVEMMDTAGVQLLLAALKQQQSQGRPLRFVGASRLLTEVSSALGLEAHFAVATEERT